MQIPIVNGIYTDNGPDIRTSYPKNLVPVYQPSGVSMGYLKPADGIIANGTGLGETRGGINWNNVCYRVTGDRLVKVDEDGTVTDIGDVGNDGLRVTMDYSFDRLAIASNKNLYYYDGNLLTQVTDPDLGLVVDVRWVDGYFMTTDGESLVVTELNDPTDVNPVKYGSSEIDPDPVEALLKLRNEVCALNRYTCEFFRNVGGTLFPFQRIEGAQIQKGCVGTHACCIYLETIAFMGGGRNEQPSVYMAADSRALKVSTREIDLILEEYTENQLFEVKIEARNDKDANLLYIHLPDKTLVYDHTTSQALQSPTWHILSSSLIGFSQYRAQNLVYCYGQWLVGDPESSAIGYLSDDVGEHYGETVNWQFGTSMIYNEGNGLVVHDLELVALTGRVALGSNPKISTSFSLDGQLWSQDRYVTAGTVGNRTKRLWWSRQGSMRNFRLQRFSGPSDAHLSFARLEATVEPLAN